MTSGIAVYNEIEPYAADWLENLEVAGHIAPGRVDRRSIHDVTAADVRDATQFHAFAGIGVWSYALRRAGWSDSRRVWTGSCPCQPFSSAGQGRGFDDPKHLWPDWFRLIRECRPGVIFGEQVSSPAGLAWFDAVSADLESEGYAVGAADLCAAGVGAPHLRQRLYFMVYAHKAGWNEFGSGGVSGDIDASQRHDADRRRATQSVADAENVGRRSWRPGESRDGGSGELGGLREARGVADAEGDGREQGRGSLEERSGPCDDRRIRGVADPLPSGLPFREREELRGTGRGEERRAAEQRSGSPWANIEWLECKDGKRRPAQPGIFPLATRTSASMGADGATITPSRVGMLRGYGNALCAEVAVEFIKSAMDIIG